jgi:DNA polymerase-3 subunit gamma/tau
MSTEMINSDGAEPSRQGEYVVIARRYRPQTFDDLIGQEHIARALGGAIASSRVGHAYLFTGARGVGKTSAARILAKALNCEQGPTPTPCNQCDLCRSISVGDDVDVLEIDGASNRGIDEIRQLRQNVSVRPSRCRFKVYIIDEVHMLTREAFNALLKTLEEPPEHVKFIFCTTEPGKIPITILSRCQRFDFAGISSKAIAARLAQVCQAEGVESDPEALQVLARRAAGSMRDSQSLLEQLLAFASGQISTDDVHAMLGTAGDRLLEQMVDCLAGRDPAGALAALDSGIGAGVDPGQMLEQLLGFLRDAMVKASGADAELLLFTSPGTTAVLDRFLQSFGLQSILAAMQILDQTLGRMRISTQQRTLAELALVRLASLDDLDALPEMIARLQSDGGVSSGGPGRSAPGGRAAQSSGTPGGPAGSSLSQSAQAASGRSERSPGTPGKKKAPADPAEPPPPNAPVPGDDDAAAATLENDISQESAGSPTPTAVAIELTEENAIEVWSRAVAGISGLAAEPAKQFQTVAIPAPNHLEIVLKPEYNFAKSVCEKPEQLAAFEKAVAELVGRPIRIRFSVATGAKRSEGPSKPRATVKSTHQRLMEVAEHPMLRRAADLFGAQPTNVVDPPSDK